MHIVAPYPFVEGIIKNSVQQKGKYYRRNRKNNTIFGR